MTDHNHDHDKREPAPDKPLAPAVSAGAVASLAALSAGLNTVDLGSVAGRSGLPMLQFKREGDGTWMHGQRRTIVEDNSRWAVNPLTFKRGHICFGDGNKRLGERLTPVTLPMAAPWSCPTTASHGWSSGPFA